MSEIMTERHGAVALIRFNRPEQYNTFNATMLEGLSDFYRECDADDAVRAVVLTGNGPAFCAGADLSDASSFSADQSEGFSSCPLTFQAWDLRKPVIAACNGHAIGVGMGIASQCDLRFVAEEGKYGFMQARRGVLPDFAVHYSLPRLIGLERALDLLMSGRRLSGQEVRDMGLASEVLPADRVLERAMEKAEIFASQSSPLVMAMVKRLTWQSQDLSRDAVVAKETQLLLDTMKHGDAVEGGMAFVERRQPDWKTAVPRDWDDSLWSD